MNDINLSQPNQIEKRRNEILKLAKKLNTTLLIKGPYDYISDGQSIKINRTGCPEMSIGGTGDVLAGLCACFLATENTQYQSACSGAFINGIIGEFCKENIGPRFTAMDMIDNMNRAIKSQLKF